MTSNPVVNLKMLLESQTLKRAPFPVPVGWYFIDYSENLKPGELRNINVFGQEWVLFRSESGEKVGVTDPYCPHLGAHIGHGGKVCGDNVRCPFHHWEYDTEGWCKNIPYAKVMPPIIKKAADPAHAADGREVRDDLVVVSTRSARRRPGSCRTSRRSRTRPAMPASAAAPGLPTPASRRSPRTASTSRI